MSKKFSNFCSDGYFEFWVKNLQKGVKICNSDAPFFFFFLGWLVSDLWQIKQIKIFQFCLKIYNLCRLLHQWVGVWFCELVDGGVFLLTFDCLLKAPQPITGLFFVSVNSARDLRGSVLHFFYTYLSCGFMIFRASGFQLLSIYTVRNTSDSEVMLFHQCNCLIRAMYCT